MLILYGARAKKPSDWGPTTMFSAWGAFVYRFRRPIALLSIVIAVASSMLASGVTGALSAGGRSPCAMRRARPASQR